MPSIFYSKQEEWSDILAKSLKNPHFDAIPTTLTRREFNLFIFPHLSKGVKCQLTLPLPTTNLAG